MNTTPCKGCGKPIIWGLTKDGKKIPLDARAPVYVVTALEYPATPKDLEIVRVDRANPLGPGTTFRWAKSGGAVAFAAYVTHFATCSHANEFSKKGKIDGPEKA